MNWNKVTVTKDIRKNRTGYLVRWYGEYCPATDAYKRYCRSFKTRKLAEQFASKRQEQINDGDPKDPVDITLKQLCDDVVRIKEQHLKAATLIGYDMTRKQLLAFFGPNTKITSINKQKATEFITSRELISDSHVKSGKTELSGWGYKCYLKNCSAIFAMAVDWEYVKKNPFSKIQLSTPISQDWHFFDQHEFNRILKVTSDFRLRCLYATMYGTGLRIGEAISLLWNGKDIDFENNRINLRNRAGTASLPPFAIKDHQNRSIPMPDWLSTMLVKLQNTSKPQNPFVFLTDQRWRTVQQKWSAYQAQKKTNK
jgi:integrase